MNLIKTFMTFQNCELVLGLSTLLSHKCKSLPRDRDSGVFLKIDCKQRMSSFAVFNRQSLNRDALLLTITDSKSSVLYHTHARPVQISIVPHHHHHQCSANDGWKTIAHTRNRAPGELLLLQGDCEYCIFIDLLLQGSNWSILRVSDTDCGPGFSNCNLFPTGQFHHLRGVIASMHPIPTLQLQLHSEMNRLECVRALSMCVLINSK